MVGGDAGRRVVAPLLGAGCGAVLVVAVGFSVGGVWGGMLVGVDWLGVFEGSFWGNMQSSVDFVDDVLNGVIKSVVFGFVCAWIAVYQGYDCVPTSAGISSATTKTVVYSSLAVLGLDGSADLDAAQRRYRELAMAHHPDRGGDAAQFQAIQEAIAILRRC